MHTWLRRIHLYCAFVLMAFVVMYFVTGWVLTHGRWVGQATESSARRTVPLQAGVLSAKPDEDTFAGGLQAQLGLGGKRALAKRNNDGTWRFSFFRPGHQVDVTVASDLTSAVVVEKQFGWQRVMVGFHRLHGYGGGWFYDLWAVLYDLASAAMIVFAVTGVVLWYRLARRHLPGWIILACGFTFTSATLGYLLLRR